MKHVMIKTVLDLTASPNPHLIITMCSKKSLTLKILTSQCITSKNSHTHTHTQTHRHTHTNTSKILHRSLEDFQSMSDHFWALCTKDFNFFQTFPETVLKKFSKGKHLINLQKL